MIADFAGDWRDLLRQYGTPTVVKQELLLPALVALPLTGALLDVGCGTGYFSEAFAARRPELDVTGVDISAEGFPSSTRVRYAVMDARALQFATGAFDSVLLINVLGVWGDPATRVAIVKEALRVRRPGGTLCVVVPSADLWTYPSAAPALLTSRSGELVAWRARKVDGTLLEFVDNVVPPAELLGALDGAGGTVTVTHASGAPIGYAHNVFDIYSVTSITAAP